MDKKPLPKVSILLNVQNTLKPLEPTIQSIYRQTHINWELYVVLHDAASNFSREAQYIALNAPRQKVNLVEVTEANSSLPNQQLSDSINGAFVLITEPGVLFSEIYLEQAIEKFEQETDTSFIYSDYIPYTGVIGSHQYFEKASVPVGKFTPQSVLQASNLPMSYLINFKYLKESNLENINSFNNKWTNFLNQTVEEQLLNLFAVNEKVAYISAPLITQNEEPEVGRLYFKASLIQKFNKLFEDQDLDWSRKICKSWNQDPDTLTFCFILGENSKLTQIEIDKFLINITDSTFNYIVLSSEKLDFEFPGMNWSTTSPASLKRIVQQIGNRVHLVILNQSFIALWLNNTKNVIFRTLWINSLQSEVEPADLEAFDVLYNENQSLQLYEQIARSHNCKYLHGLVDLKDHNKNFSEVVRAKEVILSSQKFLKESHLKLISQTKFSRVETLAEQQLSLSVVILLGTHKLKDIERSLNIWNEVKEQLKVDLKVVNYADFDTTDLKHFNLDIITVEKNNKFNRGSACNIALDHCQQEWLLFVDANIIISPNFFDVVIQYLTRLKSCKCFYARSTISLPYELPDNWDEFSYSGWVGSGVIFNNYDTENLLIVNSNALRKIGGFSTSFSFWPYDFIDLVRRLEWSGEEAFELPRSICLKPWSLNYIPGTADENNRIIFSQLGQKPKLQPKNTGAPVSSNIGDLEEFQKMENFISMARGDSAAQAERLYETAKTLLWQGSSLGALECLQMAHFLMPERLNYGYLLAQVYLQRGNLKALDRCLNWLEFADPNLEGLQDLKILRKSLTI